MKTVKFFSIILAVIFLNACTTDTTTTTGGDDLGDFSGVDTTEAKVEKGVESDASVVIIEIPSPIETAIMLQKAGAKYDENILNAADKWSEYSTTTSQALNLGIYSADLSFASLFDQSQAAISYISVNKNLAEELGILDAIPGALIERMEKNFQNKDSLMNIISETLMNSDSFLKENERASTASVVLVGGWVEGLYIATKLAQNVEDNKELLDKIVDQKLSLDNLRKMLVEHKNEAEVATIIPELDKIATVFDKVKVEVSGTEVVTDTVNKRSVIQSVTKVDMSPEVYEELCAAIDELRTRIVTGALA